MSCVKRFAGSYKQNRISKNFSDSQIRVKYFREVFREVLTNGLNKPHEWFVWQCKLFQRLGDYTTMEPLVYNFFFSFFTINNSLLLGSVVYLRHLVHCAHYQTRFFVLLKSCVDYQHLEQQLAKDKVHSV